MKKVMSLFIDIKIRHATVEMGGLHGGAAFLSLNRELSRKERVLFSSTNSGGQLVRSVLPTAKDDGGRANGGGGVA